MSLVGARMRKWVTAALIVSLVAALFLFVGATSSSPEAVAATPGQGAPFDCSGGVIYNVQTGTGSTGILNALTVSGMSGTTAVPAAQVSNAIPNNSPNAMGISPGGTAAWALAPNSPTVSGDTLTFTLRKYDPVAQTWTSFTSVVNTTGVLPPGVTASSIGTIVAGAVDPLTGNFFWAFYANSTTGSPRGSLTFFGWNTTTNTSLGVVATSTLPQAGTLPSGGANGDFAFDSQGNVYVVSSIGTNAALGRISGPLPGTLQTSPPALTDTNLATYANPNSNAYNGVAFDNNGNLYLEYSSGSETAILKVNPATGAIEEGPANVNYSGTGGTIGTDLGACSVPPIMELQKNVVNRQSPTDQFNLSITGGGITGGNTATTSGTATGVQAAVAGPVVGTVGNTYTFTETAAGTTNLANYTITWQCADDAFKRLVGVRASGTGPSFQLTLTAAEIGQFIICTFTNTSLGLTLTKQVNNGTSGATTAATAWTLAAAGTTNGLPTISGPTGSAPVTNAFVPPGTYNLSETGPAGYTPSNWVCTGAASSTPTSVTVALGENVTCTISNTAIAPKLTLVKEVDNGATGATAVPTDWTLTATGTTTGLPTISGVTGAPAVTGAALAIGTYNLTESGPAGYTPSDWSCTGAQSFTSTTVTLALDQDATCTIKNTAIPPTITFTKSVASVMQQADGTWTVTYQIVARNTGNVNGVYSLQDTLRFGTGISINSASWTGPTTGTWPAPNTTPTATLATNLPLAAGATHTYTVTVNATVAAGVIGTPAGDCPGAGSTANGAFNNQATLTVNGEPTDQVACDEPSRPRIEKAFQSAVQNPTTPSEWTVSYLLTVSNAGQPHASFFTLTDTPSFSPGVTVTAATVNGAPVTFTPPTLTVVGTPTSIAAGATLSYEVAFTVTLDRTATGFSPDCVSGEAGHGFFNAATLTTGEDDLTADDCGNIPPGVDPTVAKTVTSTVQNPDGTWTITYAVTVTQPPTGTANPDGLAGLYSLSDTLNFGAGITINTAAWTGATTGTWALPATTASLATDRAVAAGVTDTYTVTVNASVSSSAFTNGTTKCASGEIPAAGGFLNQATLTVAGASPEDVFACDEPSQPRISKTFQSAVQNPASPAEWTVSYLLTVDNTGQPHDSFFTLTDTPSFSPGVTATAATVAGAPVTFTPPTLIVVGTPTTIAAGATLQYEVTFTVTVDRTATGFSPDCVAGEAGHGFFNAATLTTGGNDLTADDCGNIPPGVSPTVAKTVTSTVQNADGTWTITYAVTVTQSAAGSLENPAGLAGLYSLSDTLNFGGGITINSASWTGATTGTWPAPNTTTTVTLATDRAIAAGVTDTYTVTVNATASSSAFTNGTAECDRAETPAAGGFLNQATLTAGGTTHDVFACDEPSQPRISKTFQSAVQNPASPTEWTVSYLLTVDNTGQPHDNFFTLTDTPSFSPGVTVTAATVNGAPATFTPPTLTVVGTPTSIAAGQVLEFPVTFTVTVDQTAPGFSADCTGTPGNGFFNAATLTTGGNDLTADDCGNIAQAVNPTVAKTVTSTLQNPDGTWTITYAVTVTQPPTGTANPDGLAGLYSLSDTLNFGGGITINIASWTGPTSGAWALPATTAALATDRVIPAGVTDTYTVTVNATASSSAFANGTAECDSAETPAAGGFLNQATLTAGGTTHDVFACDEPSQPRISKTFQSAIQNPANPPQWTVSYLLTVDNTGQPHDSFFTLTDTPSFSPGVTVTAATVNGAPATFTPPTLTVVGTPTTIAAGATLSYEVTFTVNLDATAPGFSGDCTGTPGNGFFNAATLTTGGNDLSADDCGDIPPGVNPTVAKTVTSTVQNPDGTWTITYAVTVTQPPTGTANPDGLAGLYSLSDTLNFGGGITINTASWTGATTGTWPLPATTATLATDRAIAAGVTDTYTVTVNASVSGSAFTNGTTKCDSAETPSAGGFLNQATLTEAGTTPDDVFACDEPSQPRISKAFQSAVQNPATPTEWTVSYLLTVDNTGQPHDNFFTLTDTPSFSPGVTVTAATVKGAPAAFIPPTLTVVGTPTSIAAGQVLEFPVTFTVTVGRTAPGFSADCTGTPGNGFFNAATLTTGGNDLTADDCGNIPPAVDPTVAKTVTSTVQNADGTWTITYAVTVTQPPTGTANPSGLSGLYSLSDTLSFGAGITINTASWTGATTGTWPAPNTTTTATLATDRVIAAGVTDTYTVTVNATVTQAAVTNDTTECDSAETPAAGGFLNQATLTVAGATPDDVFACDEPASVTVTKTAAVPTFDPATDHWTIVYTVELTNASLVPQFYNLADAPNFPAGVSIVSGSATGPSGPIASWNGTSNTTLATGVPIAAAIAGPPTVPTVHTYTLTVVADVAGATATTPVDCVTSTPGAGFFNQATLSQGPVNSTADACQDIPVPTISHTKAVESVTQQPNGTWMVVYAITVRNTGDVGGDYSLADTLRFGAGITVNSADWSLNGGGSNPFTSPQTLATQRPLDVNGADVYTVTVNATVGTGVIGSPEGVCPGAGSTANGAFNNEAGLTVNGETTTEEACAEPSAPRIEKTFLTADQNITNAAAWTVTYQLTVNNSGNPNANFFTLTDTPSFSPGVTITGASVAGTPVTFTPPTLTVVGGPTQIPAGETRTFEVAYNVMIDRTAPGFTPQCGSTPAAGNGFFNAATLTTGEDEVHVEDCGSIPDPVPPTVAKTVSNTVQNTDGTWTITYAVTVAQSHDPAVNPGEFAGLYDLSDTLMFGGGITVNSAQFFGPTGAGSWPAPNTTPTAVLATARTIPAGQIDTYTIVVNASVSSSAFTNSTAECSAAGTPSAGGFLNTAALMSEGRTLGAFACSEPAPVPVAPPSAITPSPVLPVTG
jgi:Prealbumin-like fold domain